MTRTATSFRQAPCALTAGRSELRFKLPEGRNRRRKQGLLRGSVKQLPAVAGSLNRSNSGASGIWFFGAGFRTLSIRKNTEFQCRKTPRSVPETITENKNSQCRKPSLQPRCGIHHYYLNFGVRTREVVE